MTYLTQGLQRALQRHPHAVALRHMADGAADRTWTFATFADQVGRHAAALQARGVAAGDRVALLAPNDDRLITALVACWWLGAVACPLNTRAARPELQALLADCDARLLVSDAAVHHSAVATFDELSAQARHLAPLPDTRTGGADLAAILYTGGTTGRAKGVLLSHANFWSAAIARGAELANPPDAVSLLVAPLFHVAGLSRLIGQSIVGGGCVTLAQSRPDAWLAAIQRHGIGDIIVVPTMLQALLDAPGFDAAPLQSLQRIAFGAAPMPPDLLQRALAAWPRAEFFQAYGLTETAGAVCINLPANHRNQDDGGRLLRSVGRAGLGAEIRVVDAGGRDVARGDVGEIVVRGPMVTRGYWRQPDATAAAFRDGWLRTGDGARMDDRGHIFIADRLKDMVISGGENVYPAEVEAVLRLHPAVADAAVIGVPHAHWGEAVHAVVVPRAAGLDTARLQAWCRERLAGYKCPRSIAVRAALPLSAAGKVLKTVLRAEHVPPNEETP